MISNCYIPIRKNLPRVVLSGIVGLLAFSSCLKLDESPLDTYAKASALALFAASVKDPQYRFSYTSSSGMPVTLALFSSPGCPESSLVPGTQRTLNPSQTTSYSSIKSGDYYFGIYPCVSPGYYGCVVGLADFNGSYTLTETDGGSRTFVWSSP